MIQLPQTIVILAAMLPGVAGAGPFFVDSCPVTLNDCPIHAVGDSHTARGAFSTFADHTNGIGGATCTFVRQNLNRSWLHDGELYLIECGGNDYASGASPVTSSYEVLRMRDAIVNRGGNAVFVTAPSPQKAWNNTATINTYLADMVALLSPDIRVIDANLWWVQTGRWEDPSLYVDWGHLTEEGYRQYDEFVAREVPEPGSHALVWSGVLGVAGLRRWRG